MPANLTEASQNLYELIQGRDMRRLAPQQLAAAVAPTDVH